MKNEFTYNDIAVVIGFPDNWAKGEKIRDRLLYSLGITYTQYYKVGHAALLLIKRETGEIEYFDYGRYIAPHKKGRVRSKDTDPKLSIPIKAKITASGELNNLFEIMNYLDTIEDDTHGHGRTYFSVCKNISFEAGKKYINKLIAKGSIKYITYGLSGMNCSSFVTKTLINCIGERKKRWNLYFSETIAPTPLGNVVNASENGEIWESVEGNYIRLKMNRLKVIKNIFENIQLSLYKNKHLEKNINNFEHSKDFEKVELPDKAQYLFSLGESTWMHIYKNDICGENEYVVESYTDFKKMNYSIIVEPDSDKFNLDIPYKFDYECNRLVTTIVQNEAIFSFFLKRENELNEAKTGKIIYLNNKKQIK